MNTTGEDAAGRALWLPLDTGVLPWPQGPVAFLGARVGPELLAHDGEQLWCQQDFKPWADALTVAGREPTQLPEGGRFALVLALLPRQRDQRRALYARALDVLAPEATLLVAVANAAGAGSAQTDLARLAGPVQHLSKHKCRVFWVRPTPASVDADRWQAWRDLEDLRRTATGLISRPGLFAWDRIDAASRLLAAHLPNDLAGRVADLGAGSGYLAVQLLRRCPDVRHVDLYEADARALPAARANLQALGAAASFEVHWHDVSAGVAGPFDAIISNPPFHQGHAGEPALGQAFIRTAARALRPGGRFLLVANRHLPYEATVREHFTSLATLAQGEGFKVLEARR